jgi:sulfopyruvate decarboxylase subunit alpha
VSSPTEAPPHSSFDGPGVAAALDRSGVTDIVWVPDSELGRWDRALSTTPGLRLLRVCREGEALALAGGLLIGGRRPIVMMQCTGLFEAGDALRNLVYDLNLPLFLLVGVRSLLAHRLGATTDTCPLFAEPVLQAWRIPYVVLEPDRDGPEALRMAYTTAWNEGRAGVALLPE